MDSQLQQAIEDLYVAFRRPRPETIDGCECCLARIDVDALIHTPLRDLSYQQLSEYVTDVIYTVGSADDFRYFLPRLLELALIEPSYANDPELLFRKLRLAGLRSWPSTEQRAIESLVDAIARRFGHEALERSEIDTWICALGQISEDVTPHLQHLLDDRSAARHNLYGFYDWNRRDVEKRRSLGNAFWVDGAERINPNVEHINAWFRRPEVSAAIDRAYADASTRTD
jgi:hypothetical protein